MKVNIHIIALLGMLVFFPSYGQSVSPDEIRGKIVDFSSRIAAIDCAFVQTKSSPMLAEPQVARGHMTFRKPDFLKWEYFSPFTFAITVDKGAISIESEGKRKTSDSGQNKLFKELLNLIEKSIDGSVVSDDKLFTTEFGQSGNSVVLTMFPVKPAMKKQFDKLLIRYDPESFQAKCFEMHETSGDNTVIEFIDSKYEFSR